MSNNAPRRGHGSTVALILLFIAAVFVTTGTFYLAKSAIGNDFDFHLDFSAPTAQARSLPPEPAATLEPTPEPQVFVISMVGDCTIASSQTENAFDRYIDENDYSWPFSGTVDILSQDDFTLANLECSLSDEHYRSASTFAFLGKADYAQILSEGSVEAVTNGNNHTKDFGEGAEADSRAAVEAVNVGYIGATEAQIFTTERGLKIGVYCPGWGNATIPNVEQVIPALREDGADVVIFAPHWGVEGKYHQSAEQELVAHAAIDAGADIVCGTHPHVLQPMEEYNGGIIFYSLGNWSFGGNTAPRDRDTAIAQVTITMSPDGECTISAHEVIPCCLSSSQGVNDFRPEPYEDDSEDYERVMTKLEGTYAGRDLVVDYSFLYG